MTRAHVAWMRVVLPLLCLLLTTGCTKNSPTGPDQPLGTEFQLAPGEVARIPDASLLLQFVGVTGDSRCPADAVCIQGGDAVVVVRVLDHGSATDYELHTGDAARSLARHRRFLIRLRELQPYPFSARPVEASDYRATLVVTED